MAAARGSTPARDWRWPRVARRLAKKARSKSTWVDSCLKLHRIFECLKFLFPSQHDGGKMRTALVQPAFMGLMSVIADAKSQNRQNDVQTKDLMLKLLDLIMNECSYLLSTRQLAQLKEQVRSLCLPGIECGSNIDRKATKPSEMSSANHSPFSLSNLRAASNVTTTVCAESVAYSGVLYQEVQPHKHVIENSKTQKVDQCSLGTAPPSASSESGSGASDNSTCEGVLNSSATELYAHAAMQNGISRIGSLMVSQLDATKREADLCMLPQCGGNAASAKSVSVDEKVQEPGSSNLDIMIAGDSDGEMDALQDNKQMQISEPISTCLMSTDETVQVSGTSNMDILMAGDSDGIMDGLTNNEKLQISELPATRSVRSDEKVQLPESSDMEITIAIDSDGRTNGLQYNEQMQISEPACSQPIGKLEVSLSLHEARNEHLQNSAVISEKLISALPPKSILKSPPDDDIGMKHMKPRDPRFVLFKSKDSLSNGEMLVDRISSESSTSKSWGNVDHLLDGCDEQEKASILKERARRIMEQQEMFAAHKLSLVLDLDHTLLNSVVSSEVSSIHEELLRKREEKDRNRAQQQLFWLQHLGMWTKLRPGIWKFLEKASKLFELHICTMGSKRYATEMAKIIDPTGNLFAGRVIAKGHDGPIFDGDEVPKSKDLDGVLGMESAVLIIDDTAEVWPHNPLNLIVVERYTYFPGQHTGPAFLDAGRDESAENGTLACCLAFIERIHKKFFAHDSPNDCDARLLLAEQRRSILAGCRVVFSGIFPKGVENPHLHHLWQIAEKLGAVCTNQVDGSVTHVVANVLGTEKVNWALSTGRHVVTQRWLEASHVLYRRASELDFLPKPERKIFEKAPSKSCPTRLNPPDQ